MSVVLLGLAPRAASAADCATLTRDAMAQVTLAQSAADADGALGGLFAVVTEGLAACPDAEALLYVRARLAELGYGGNPADEAKRFAEEAARRQPGSVRIATVLARLDGSVEAARRAAALDPSYVPAQAALALALAAHGAGDEALKLLPARATTRVEHVTRARVLLAIGRFANAERMARLAGNGPVGDIEPTPVRAIERERYEIMGLALLAEHRLEAARRALSTAAAFGSTRASEALAHLR